MKMRHKHFSQQGNVYAWALQSILSKTNENRMQEPLGLCGITGPVLKKYHDTNNVPCYYSIILQISLPYLDNKVFSSGSVTGIKR